MLLRYFFVLRQAMLLPGRRPLSAERHHPAGSCLRACYAMSGTDIATDVAYAPTLLCRTEKGYAGTNEGSREYRRDPDAPSC
eukprot:3811283-Rhodomonas_salina.3